MKKSLYLLSLILAVSFAVLSTANVYAAATDTWIESAASLPGVKSVDNKLTLNDKIPAAGSDAWLTSKVAVLGSPPAHGTPVETIKSPSSILVAEVGKDEKPSHPPERLYGTWTAKDVDAKMGEVRIRLTFRREKNATFLAWSDIPFVGQVRDLKGPFSVHGDTISSEAIRDGEKAKFSFENDQLVLRFKSGKVVRFDRE